MRKIQNTRKWNNIAKHFSAKGFDGEALVSKLKQLNSFVNANTIKWLGGLFDPNIGGFYYSNSAKENDEYLPDIESTSQALNILHCAGVFDSYDWIPPKMRKSIGCFITSCADQNGFFYNPQWSKEKANSLHARRGRDLTSAISLVSKLSIASPYPTALDNLNDHATSEFEYSTLKTKESFEEYLRSLYLIENDHLAIHTLCSQRQQIKAAGFADATVDYLSEMLSNGRIEKISDTQERLSAYSACVTLCNDLEHRFDFYATASELALSELLKADKKLLPYCEHPWGFFKKLFVNLSSYGSDEDKRVADELKTKICAVALDALDALCRNISVFSKSDGSMSYTTSGSSEYSQGMKVAEGGAYEGDVNATLIFLCTIDAVWAVLGIKEQQIHPLSNDDLDDFIKYALEQ